MPISSGSRSRNAPAISDSRTAIACGHVPRAHAPARTPPGGAPSEAPGRTDTSPGANAAPGTRPPPARPSRASRRRPRGPAPARPSASMRRAAGRSKASRARATSASSVRELRHARARPRCAPPARPCAGATCSERSASSAVASSATGGCATATGRHVQFSQRGCRGVEPTQQQQPTRRDHQPRLHRIAAVGVRFQDGRRRFASARRRAEITVASATRLGEQPQRAQVPSSCAGARRAEQLARTRVVGPVAPSRCRGGRQCRRVVAQRRAERTEGVARVRRHGRRRRSNPWPR